MTSLANRFMCTEMVGRVRGSLEMTGDGLSRWVSRASTFTVYVGIWQARCEIQLCSQRKPGFKAVNVDVNADKRTMRQSHPSAARLPICQ